jgi:Tat protein secretion system quality control protein TatD with DNase activity
MFDEAEYDGCIDLNPDQKVAHYQSVLTPKSEDLDFLRSLPSPRPFGHFLDQTKEYLQLYSLALVGEVGLDRSFRIPEAWLPEQVDSRDDALTPGGREGRKLSPYRVSMEHQKKVLVAQLNLAGELSRAVSVHGVQAHGIVYETIASTWKGHEIRTPSKKETRKRDTQAPPLAESLSKSSNVQTLDRKPYPPRLCLHSFSGPAETVKQYIAPSVPCEVFFSFSTTINAWSDSSDGKVETAVKAVPSDRLLVESDLHTAGEKMDQYLEEVVRRICLVRQWTLREGVTQLAENWRRFVFGSKDHAPSRKMLNE